MAKFSRAGQTGGGSALERLAAQAQPELPTGTPQPEVQAQPAPQPTPQPASPAVAADPSVNLQQAEELPAAPTIPDAQQQFESVLGEQQRQAIPDLRSRWREAKAPDPINNSTSSAKPDGGIFDRANRMAVTVEAGGLIPPVSLANTPGFIPAKSGATNGEVAQAIAEEKDGSIQAAVNRVGAVDNADPRVPTIDSDFIKAGSLVTENMVMHFAGGGTDADIETELDPVAASQTTDAIPADIDGQQKIKRVAKQQGNSQIGQQIAQEYQRLKGNEVPEKLPTKEAESLGDAFKMMWATQNPDLVNVTRDPKTQQKYLELTPKGEDVLAAGQADRRRLFPSKNVRPAKIALKSGQLPGDTGQNVVKGVQGGVGKQDFSKTLKDSMRNLANVPNVVDKQRSRILYSTALPILQNLQDPSSFDSWEATINNIGSDKVAKYTAKHGPETAQAEMQKAGFKLAQEIRAIAQERNGANYLSYAIQGFQGRISPQQSHFNPTTSKAVRFVTRNAVPSPAKPGSRVEANLRQMYAMMLVKGADAVLPEQREIKLAAALPKLEAWGDRLELALQMSDAEAEAISQAIEAGTALNDPSFPQIKPLALDPEADAELIAAIKSKGEDGPHFIDGLMDAAKYAKAKRAGRTHHSYFNAYIDGKTNGIASNGIQMGISETAKRTGVIRDSETDYLDAGDIRQQLKEDLMFSLDNNGFDGNVSEYSSELNAVARALFSHRDLNKKTTMTFGYGKEVATFGEDMYDTIQLLKADPTLISDPEMRAAFVAALPEVENRMPDAKELGDTMMTIYGPALEGVMSPEALLTRDIMRGASIMHAATNSLMSIKGPTGMDLNFGREVRLAEGLEETSYRLRGSDVAGGEQAFKAAHQAKEATSAAARTYTRQDEFSGEETTESHVGEYAYGGSVVGPVQALDAATVGLTSSGTSWNRLRSASGNNPYLHTIYDAFKADAMGYDVVLEEVNANWLNSSMEWSYLKETQKATREAMAEWKKKMADRNPNEKLTENERAYMDYLLEQKQDPEGRPTMSNFRKKIGTAASWRKKNIKPWDMEKVMAAEMRKVDYDWNDPPKEPTVRQLKQFVDVIGNMLQTDKRLTAAINHTEKNKAALKKEIMEKGYKTKSGRTIALQYYAH